MAAKQNGGDQGTLLPATDPSSVPASTEEPLYPVGFGVAVQAYLDRIAAHMAERKAALVLAAQEVTKITAQLAQLSQIDDRLTAVLVAYNLDTSLVSPGDSTATLAKSPGAEAITGAG